MNEAELGERLRKERLKQRLRVIDFPGCDPGQISRIENGIWKRSETVFRYAEALGFSLRHTYILTRIKVEL